MFSMLRRIVRQGILTERIGNQDLDVLGIEVRRGLKKRFHGGIAIRQVDAGSCNACELEIHALNNAYYNIASYGVHFVASPRFADVLLVTGPVTRHMEAALLRTYAAMLAPKWVIAAGDCAKDGGEFGCNYACVGGVEKVMPVDVRIAGCPPTPHQLLAGILALMKAPEKSNQSSD